MNQYTIILIILFLISCQKAQTPVSQTHDVDKHPVKTTMELGVEIRDQGDGGYTIVWYDTLGQYQKLDKFNRPFHIVCDIFDKHDTVGYYHGLRNPSTWTSYGTKDSIITIYFSIARNTFSEMPDEQQMEYADISCNFIPVRLNTTAKLDERITLLLTEQ
jgi:hypothetical protein